MRWTALRGVQHPLDTRSHYCHGCLALRVRCLNTRNHASFLIGWDTENLLLFVLLLRGNRPPTAVQVDGAKQRAPEGGNWHPGCLALNHLSSSVFLRFPSRFWNSWIFLPCDSIRFCTLHFTRCFSRNYSSCLTRFAQSQIERTQPPSPTRRSVPILRSLNAASYGQQVPSKMRDDKEEGSPRSASDGVVFVGEMHSTSGTSVADSPESHGTPSSSISSNWSFLQSTLSLIVGCARRLYSTMEIVRLIRKW